MRAGTLKTIVGMGLLALLMGAAVPAMAADPITLKLATSDSGSKERKAAETFSKTHPGVKIEIVNLSGGYVDKVVTMIAGGVPPDIIYNAARMQGALEGKGVLQDLTPFIRADKDFDLRDFYPGIMAAFTKDGKVFAIPRGNQPHVLFYDTTLFGNAGLAPPSASWTWRDQFRTVARKLTQDKDDDGVPETFGFAAPSGFWWPIVWDNGASFLDRTGTRFTLDSPGGVSGLELADEVMRERYAAVGWGHGRAGLMDHTVGMFQTNGTTMAFLIRQGVTQGWNVAPLPHGPQGSYTLIDGAGYAIPVGAPHPQLAWEFISFLTSAQGLTQILQNGAPGTVGMIPTRQAVARGPQFLGLPPPPDVDRQVFLDALSLKHARVPYVGGVHWPDIDQALREALQPVWAGRASVKNALAGVAPRIEGILQEGR